jgi:hypothetical protein
MIRLPLGARLFLATAGSALLLAPSSAIARPNDPPPTRLLVTAREFSFALSKWKLAAGPSIIQLYNYGEDPHDLQIQRSGSRRIRSAGEVEPGETGTLEFKLRRKSTYTLWCSIEGHRDLGMLTSLKTRAKRPGR